MYILYNGQYYGNSNTVLGNRNVDGFSIVPTIDLSSFLKINNVLAGTNITVIPTSTGVTISSAGGGSITGATNGLSVTGKKIRLGGTLTGNTSIVLSNNNLTITGGTGTTFTTTNLLTQGKLFTTSTAARAAIGMSSLAGNPTTVIDGDLWFNSSRGMVGVGSNGGTGGIATFSIGAGAIAATQIPIISNTTGRMAGDSNLVWVAGTGRLGIRNSNPSATAELNFIGLTALNDTAGLALVNSSVATVGVQQVSPMVRWSGNGWQTNTGGSQRVDFASYVVPTQGTANPDGNWILARSINGGAYATKFNVNVGPTATNMTLSGTDSTIQWGAASMQYVNSLSQINVSGTRFWSMTNLNPTTNGYAFDVGVVSNTLTSGNNGVARISGTIAPTSGNAAWYGLIISNTLNQTSTANGNTTWLNIAPTHTRAAGTVIGVDYNPVNTNITGATHYAAMFRSGKVGIGTTTTGTTAILNVGASTTVNASLKILAGTAPSSPVDGDIWYDGTNLKMRVGGVTKTFTLT